MTKFVLVCALAACSAFAQNKTKGIRPAGVPAGAEQVEPYLWRYTDSAGKKWVYRQTPFGYNRFADMPEAPAPKPGEWTTRDTPFGKVRVQGETEAEKKQEPTPVVVKDLGDSLEFHRQMPFGEQKWTRKKAELTESDRQLLKEAEAVKTSESGKTNPIPEKR